MKHYGFENAEGSSLKNLTVPSGTILPDGSAGDPPNVGELFFKTDEEKLYIVTALGSPQTWVDVTAAASANAATLDGLDSTQFLRSDIDDTTTGRIIFNKNSFNPNTNQTTAIELYGSYGGGIQWNDNNNGYWSAWIKDVGASWILGNWGGTSFSERLRVTSTELTYNSNTVWHAGNDGTGSGLDADLLDGISSLSFLRSDVADQKTSGTLTFNDAVFCAFGTDNDILHFWSGSNYFIDFQTINSSLFIRDIGDATRFTFDVENGSLTVHGDTSTGNGGHIRTEGISPRLILNETQDGAGEWTLVADGNELSIRYPSTGTSPYPLTIQPSSTSVLVYNNRVLTTADEGSGNGLDADTLDNVQGASYLRSDVDDNFTGVRLNLTHSSAMLGMDEVGFDGHPIKRITCNDSGGNWNFRGGNYFSTSAKYSTSGNGSVVEIQNFEGVDGQWFCAVAPIGVGGDTITWSKELKLTTSNFTVDNNTVWHAGNDGTGSGLDADLLDGVQGASYLRSDISTTFTGNLLQINTTAGADITSTGQVGGVEVYQNTIGADAIIGLHVSGDYAVNFGLSGGLNDIAVGGRSMGAVEYRIWHAGNDGTGSGMDADLLDGQHGSYYQQNLQNVYSFEVAASLTGDRNVYFDFHADDINTDFSGRLIRYPGENGNFELRNQGTGSVIVAGNGFSVNTTDIHLNNSTTISSGTSGDAILTIESDTDNNNEGDHPSIRLKQDMASIDWRIGLGFDDNDISSTNNDLVINRLGTDGIFKISPDGVNIYDIYHEGNVNNISRHVFFTTNVGTLYTNQWTKIFSIDIYSQYQNFDAIYNLICQGHGLGSFTYYQLLVRVKQQAAFGNDPFIDLKLISPDPDKTSPISLKVGYVIVNNTPNTVVDFYLSSSQTYSIIDGILTAMSKNNLLITYYSSQPFSATVTGLVEGENYQIWLHQDTIVNAGDFNSYTATGIYRIDNWSGNGMTNGPTGSYSYGMLRVQNFYGNTYISQEYIPHQTDGSWIRVNWNGSWSGWREVYTSENDGSGSGLDADTLDAIESTSFLRSDVNDDFTAAKLSLTHGAATLAFDGELAPDGTPFKRITCNDGTGNWCFRGGNYSSSGEKYTTSASGAVTEIYNFEGVNGSWVAKVAIIGTNAGDIITWANTLLLDTSGFWLNGNKIWHAGNDGTGSGLDADLLGGISSPSFLRSDVADVKTSGTLTFDDNVQCAFGSGDDVIHVWNGTNYYLDFQVTDAHLYIRDVANSAVFDFNLSTKVLSIDGNTVWHAGNDGTGSGLDADLLDGVQGASYLRSDVADIKTAGTLTFNDNVFCALGTDNDIIHFWSGTNYFIDFNTANTNLYIRNVADANVFTFNVNTGDFTATGDVTGNSDLRLKENIELITDAVNKVQQIKGVTYTLKDDESKRQRTGVIAQDVEKVLPEAVVENEAGIKSVAYGNMVGLLVEAIKEQQEQIELLKAEIALLKGN